MIKAFGFTIAAVVLWCVLYVSSCGSSHTDYRPDTSIKLHDGSVMGTPTKSNHNSNTFLWFVGAGFILDLMKWRYQAERNVFIN